ncbi:MAG: hypothetical protein AB1625_14260 [Acidobacteriota bacterium]
MTRVPPTRGRYLLVGLLISASTAVAAAQDEPEPPFEFTADLVSRYVWRGYDLSHGDPALLLYLNYYSPALPGLWANVGIIGGLRSASDLGDDATDVDEVDATVGWEWEGLAGGKLTVGVALYGYLYTSTWTKEFAYEDTSDVEANLYLTWDAAEHLQPSLEYYRGLDDGIRGDYVEVGLALPFEGERWSSEPKVTAGWSNQYDVADRFTNATVTVPVSFSLGPATITPSLQWVWVDDPEGFNPEDVTGSAPKDTLFVGAVRVAFVF